MSVMAATNEFKLSSSTITVLMFIQDEIFIVCCDNCCMPLTTHVMIAELHKNIVSNHIVNFTTHGQ